MRRRASPANTGSMNGSSANGHGRAPLPSSHEYTVGPVDFNKPGRPS